MEDNSDRLSAMERELGSQRQSLNNIHNQLITLIALSGGVNRDCRGTTCSRKCCGHTPQSPQILLPHRLKPVTPSEFTGRSHQRMCISQFMRPFTLGWPLTQFADDQAKDLLGPLFLWKVDCTARFTNRTMWLTQQTGSLPWVTWAEFWLEFICDFCPKNEVQTAHTDLETSKYHQGSHSVDKYVNEFHELVDRAEYTEGANIVLKFLTWVEPHHTETISPVSPYGQPSNDIPKDWYDAAIPLRLKIALQNSAFQSTLRSNQTTATTGVGANRNPVTGVTKPHTPCSSSHGDSCDSIYWIRIKATTRPQCNGHRCDSKMRPKSSGVLLMWEELVTPDPTGPEVFNVRTHDCGRTFRLRPAWASLHWMFTQQDHRSIGGDRGSCTRRDHCTVGFYVLRRVK